MFIRPYLKYPGNKFRLLSYILKHFPDDPRLIELFCGSCAVFLNSNFKKALLNDTNEIVINTHKLIQLQGESFINQCRELFTDNTNTKDMYNRFRDEYNSLPVTSERKSHLFIYLNRHCFNGLIRHNSSGKFNVPFGQYTHTAVPIIEILNFYKKTNECDVTFTSLDFTNILFKSNEIRDNDVLYCDPPYSPLSKTSNFSGYTYPNFNPDQHRSLVSYFEETESFHSGHVTGIISNHDTYYTRTLYPRASLIVSMPVSRTISAIKEHRKNVNELLVIYNKGR